ncbi:MAG: phosphonate metabolism transcriptional regulator PhnF [Pseudomonadota bacterium]
MPETPEGPPWRAIAADMSRKIATGEWKEGQRLETESQLAERYGVNRHTLRQALKDLARRKLVEAAPRRGTFVTSRRIEVPITEDTSLARVIGEANRRHSARLVASRTTIAPPDMADRLEIAEQSRVLEVSQIRLANDVPFAWVVSWFPEDRSGRLLDWLRRDPSINNALAQIGIKNVRRRETLVSARSATVAERNHLELGRGATVFALDYVSVDSNDEPTHAARAILNAAVSELRIGGAA